MAHQSVVVQTSDVPGLICPVSASLLAGEGGGLDFGVEQGVERHSWIGVDGVVVGDRQSFEEGLVGDATQRVIDAHVDRVGVACQSQAIVQVAAGLVVLDLAGLDPGGEERDLAGDAVLFGLEQWSWRIWDDARLQLRC